MNYELIMLKGVKRMKASAKKLQSEAERAAVLSYCVENCGTATAEQIDRISKYVDLRNDCMTFVNGVVSALSSMPKGYAALLKAVYLKKTDKNLLCGKYKVSLSTFYRTLAKARSSFRCHLDSCGCTEAWFWKIFGDVCWVKNMKNRSSGGRAEI